MLRQGSFRQVDSSGAPTKPKEDSASTTYFLTKRIMADKPKEHLKKCKDDETPLSPADQNDRPPSQRTIVPHCEVRSRRDFNSVITGGSRNFFLTFCDVEFASGCAMSIAGSAAMSTGLSLLISCRISSRRSVIPNQPSEFRLRFCPVLQATLSATKASPTAADKPCKRRPTISTAMLDPRLSMTVALPKTSNPRISGSCREDVRSANQSHNAMSQLAIVLEARGYLSGISQLTRNRCKGASIDGDENGYQRPGIRH